MRTDRRQSPDRRRLSDRRSVDNETLQLLCDVYHELWAESYFNKNDLRAFCEPLVKKMLLADERLHFKK